MYLWVNSVLFYLVSYNPLLSLHILIFKLFEIWSVGGLSGWFLYVLHMSLSFFELFLTFWHNRLFQMSSYKQPLLLFPRIVQLTDFHIMKYIQYVYAHTQ